MDYIKRTLEDFILRASEQFPVILVMGPRQVGKTTFLQHLSQKERKYITLDDPLLATGAREEPKLFLERYKDPVLIDEIQYAPQLLPYIKMRVDKEKKPGQFWLTGSQQFHMMKGVKETLAGRMGILNLLGLSQWEYNRKAEKGKPFLPTLSHLTEREKEHQPLSLDQLYERIWRGSFPAVALNKNANVDLYYSSYVQTYLQRDVRDLANIGNMTDFLKFLKACAARTAQILNFSSLAKDVGISPNTAKNWLSILEASGIIYLLESYSSNVTKRVIKAPKLYFLDTGLACYLTQWPTSKALEEGLMSGAMFETFVVSEIVKSYWHTAKRAPIYYYRDSDLKEIDLLIESGQTLHPVEIKKTGAPNKNDLKHFGVLQGIKQPVGEGCIISMVDTIVPLTKGVNAVPVSMI